MTATLGAVLLGTVLLALTAEAALQVAAWWVRVPHPEDAPFTILCEGDSFTKGIAGTSFPKQLEDQLNTRAGRRLVRVVNAAEAGANSARISDRLPALLAEHRPHLLVVTTGENNSWNSVRLTPSRNPFAGAWDAALARSRLYRFLKTAAAAWSARNFHEGAPRVGEARDLGEVERATLNLMDHQQEGDVGVRHERSPERMSAFQVGWALESELRYEESLALFRRLAEEDPDDLEAYYGMATALSRMDRNLEGAAVLREALARPAIQDTTSAWFELGMMLDLGGRPDEADAAWQEGLHLFPRSTRILLAMLNSWRARGIPAWKALDLVPQIPGIEENTLITYLDALAAMSEGRAASDLETLVSAGLTKDLWKMVAAARAADVPIVFTSYPEQAYDEVVAVARAAGAPYVDMRHRFAERFPDRSVYISADGFHTNEVGNGFMAEIVAEEVIRELGLGGLAPLDD